MGQELFAEATAALRGVECQHSICWYYIHRNQVFPAMSHLPTSPSHNCNPAPSSHLEYSRKTHYWYLLLSSSFPPFQIPASTLSLTKKLIFKVIHRALFLACYSISQMKSFPWLTIAHLNMSPRVFQKRLILPLLLTKNNTKRDARCGGAHL